MFPLLAIGIGGALIYNLQQPADYHPPGSAETRRETANLGVNIKVHQNTEYMFAGQRDEEQLDWYLKPRTFGQVVDKYNGSLTNKAELMNHLFKTRNPVFNAPVDTHYSVIPQVIVPFFDKMAKSQPRAPLIDYGGRTF